MPPRAGKRCYKVRRNRFKYLFAYPDRTIRGFLLCGQFLYLPEGLQPSYDRDGDWRMINISMWYWLLFAIILKKGTFAHPTCIGGRT